MTHQPAQPSNNKRLSTKARVSIAVLIIALLCWIIWFAWLRTPSATVEDTHAKNNQTNSTVDSSKPALTVNVVTPQTQHWQHSLSANGNIAAWQEVVIGSELSGQRLLTVNVNVGDQVKRGQTLATINDTTIVAELAAAKANLAEAKATLLDAKANNQRIQQLKNTGAMSAQEAAQYQTSQLTAQARLEAAQAHINSQQLRLSQTRITSPDDGVISARDATVGSLAQAGQPLFRLIRDNRLEWRAQVTASDMYQLTEGMTVRIESPDPKQSHITGTVRMIAPVIDPTTRYGLVYVDLPNTHAVRMGMFVKGEFMLGKQAVMTIPQSALLLRDGFAYVFSVDKKQRVQQLKVNVGRRIGERIEVTGLDANAQIVATGTVFLADGDLVKVVDAIPSTPLSKQLGAQPASSEQGE